MSRGAFEAASSAGVSLSPRPISRQSSIIVIVVAFVLSGGVLVLLSGSFPEVRWGLLALILAIGLFIFIRYSLQHLELLVFALVLEENLPYLNFLPFDINTRWFLRLPLLLPLCLPALWIAYRSGLLWKGRFKAMSLLFAWDAITILYSPVPAISIGRLAPNILLFAAITASVADVSDEEGIQRLLGGFLGACCVMVFFTFIGWCVLPFNLTHMIDNDGLLRFTGLGTDPNAVGSLALATVASGVAYWPCARHWWRRLLIGVAMAGAIGFAVLADSRSETAMALLGLAMWSVWRWRVRAFAVCALIGVLGVLSYSHLDMGQRAYFNRGVTTFTGRTGAWRFELTRLKEHPLRGFGYQTEGEIFQSRYFDDWQSAWNNGPNTPLHDDYMSVAIDTGIPALLVWLIILIGPWRALFSGKADEWHLKQLFFLFVLPMLFLAFDESGMSEPRSDRGLLFFLCWAMAERYCLFRSAQAVSEAGPSPLKRLLAAPASLLMVGAICGSLLAKPAPAQAQSASPRYFATLPPGAPLPSGAQCASWVPETPETVPENAIANHTKPTSQELAELRKHGYHFTYMDDNSQYARIDGDYSGSTDMILRWAACKYGIDENVLRAQAWEESTWKQATHGDLHRDPAVCRGGSTNLWEYDGCDKCCWQSWSILQTKVVPYEWMTWPAIHESTPFAADYRAADQRSCMNGYYRTYFHDHPSHAGHVYWSDYEAARDDNFAPAQLDVLLRGCIGKHFSGDWYDDSARSYINDVWRWVQQKPWLRK